MTLDDVREFLVNFLTENFSGSHVSCSDVFSLINECFDEIEDSSGGDEF